MGAHILSLILCGEDGELEADHDWLLIRVKFGATPRDNLFFTVLFHYRNVLVI